MTSASSTLLALSLSLASLMACAGAREMVSFRLDANIDDAEVTIDDERVGSVARVEKRGVANVGRAPRTGGTAATALVPTKLAWRRRRAIVAQCHRARADGPPSGVLTCCIRGVLHRVRNTGVE